MALMPVAPDRRPRAQVWVDGVPVEAHAGQSVLTLLLARGHTVRRNEYSGEPRAGFCLMGACQDCWIWLAEDQRGRACTTPVVDGMRIFTAAPPGSA